MTAEELAEEVIEASLYWSGEDEERNPRLKRIRTLAGLILGKRLVEAARPLLSPPEEEDDPCQGCPLAECDGCSDEDN